VLPTSLTPFQVISGPAIANTGPVISPGSPKIEPVMVWFGLRLQVSLPAKRSRFVSRPMTEPGLGLPGVLSCRITEKLSVRFVRL
jgi:hypothetical protein